MKKYVLLAGILLATIAGVLFFFWPRAKSEGALWRFVPAASAWVYEHPNLGALWSERLAETSFQNTFEVCLNFALQDNGEVFLKEWEAQSNALLDFATGLPVKISGHNLGNGRMGVVFYAPLTTERISTLRRLFAPLHMAGFNSSERTYKDHAIYEIQSTDQKQRFAYLLGEDYFIGSFTPFLLEDVVRTLSSGERQAYLDARPQLEELPDIDNQDGKLYVSLTESTSYWQSIWLQSDDLSLSSPTRYRGAAALLQPHFLDTKLSWVGFIGTVDSLERQLLAGFSDNLPPRLPYLQNVPNDCAHLLRYGFSDAAKWNLHMQSLWKKQQNILLDRRLSIFSRYSIDVESLFAHIGHLSATLQMEASAGMPVERLFLLHLKDPRAMVIELKELSTLFSRQTSDYTETHGEHIIRHLALPELPYLLFGDDFSGFSEIFYTQRANFLLASSSLLTLKSALDQLEREESWGRTPDIQQQMSEEMADANFSVHVNLAKYWPKLSETLRHPWRTFFRQERIQDHMPYFFSLQLQALEDELYTQVQLRVPPLKRDSVSSLLADTEEASTSSNAPSLLSSSSPEAESLPEDSEELPDGYEEKASHTFDSPLISKPLLVYNPSRKQFEAFAQEKLDFRLHALRKTGETRWQTSLQERIISPIYAIDYFKDRRTQYLFATVSAIYVLDEKGDPLPNFPIQLPSSDSIAYLNLVDYSKTKSYRFFVSDVRGRAYILDKKGRPLPGWAPKSMRRLSEPPFHVRIGQRDCMVLPQDDGMLQMYKRIGTSYPNFPVRVGMSFAGRLYLKRGSSLSSSTFISLNPQGELLRTSLSGKIKQREPIYPVLNDATYRLIPSVTGNGYVAVAASNDQLVVLSSSGKVLFQKAISLSRDFSSQYYNLGATRSLLVFYDSRKRKAYFFALDGTEALPSPLSTSHKTALTYSRRSDSYTIYLHQGNTHLSLTHKK